MARGAEVLVIEDEDEARTFLVQILEYEGFSVLGFANGAEALNYLAQSEEPCLIVMDLRMPVMDGPRFRTAMLQDQRLAKVPVVVVTAMDPSAAAGLSAQRVLRKPVDVDALLAVIRQYC
ncbi:MAG TPA: response regulator [Candidatus Binataceae bacterium]|nr:response regulator [Candidatus Binataceae bacterium]